MIDNDVIEGYRGRAEAAGRGYQTLMNEILRAAGGLFVSSVESVPAINSARYETLR